MYSYNTVYITLSLVTPFYIKAVFMPSLFMSYGWIALITRALWKTVPRWFSDPKRSAKIEASGWFITIKKILNKTTKDSPGVYIT